MPNDDPPASDGDVTFLFTDIEGSTRLWNERPDVMRPVLARHDALLRSVIEDNSGQVFKTIGDAFCAAFRRPPDAVNAAIRSQQRLTRELPGLRVRMALHSGEAELRGGDYFGPALNHVSRLLIAGHGGQVLVSKKTADLVRGSLPDSTSLRALGKHQLRDIPSWDTIFQLQLMDLPSSFPALNTLNVAFHRGIVRAGAVAAVVIVIVGALAMLAWHSAMNEARQRRRTQALLYASDMNGAQQALNADIPGRVIDLLNAHIPPAGAEDLRTFEWRYLWQPCHDTSTYTYHESDAEVRALALSPDGILMATGNHFGKVRLWDARTHQNVSTLPGHGEAVRLARFSPDGKRLLTESFAEGYRIWSIETGKEIEHFPAGVGPLPFHFFLSDGRLAAVVPRPNHHMIICEGGSLRPLKGGSFTDTDSLAISDDGHTIVTFDAIRKRMQIWDTKITTTEIATHIRFTGPVASVDLVEAVAPDGSSIVTADKNGSSRSIWDRGMHRKIANIQNTGFPSEVSYSPDGRTVAIGGYGGTITLVNVSFGHQTALHGHKAGLNQLAFAPDGKTLASASKDGTIKLWDTATRADADELQGPNVFVCLSKDGGSMAAGGYARWSVAMPLLLWSDRLQAPIILAKQSEFTYPIAFSQDGRTLFGVKTAPTGGFYKSISASRICWWDVRSGHLVGELPMHTGGLVWAAPSPDRRSLATLSTDSGTVELWDLGSKRRFGELRHSGFSKPRVDLAFSSDGRSLAFTQWTPSEVGLWDMKSSTARVLQRFGDPPGSVCFAADGRWLAVGRGNGEIWVMDMWRSGKPSAHFMAHNDLVSALAFSPDGRTLASGGTDGIICLWNVLTWRLTLTLTNPAHTRKSPNDPLHWVSSLQFSADGNRLYSGFADGPVRIWHAASLVEIETIQRTRSSKR